MAVRTNEPAIGRDRRSGLARNFQPHSMYTVFLREMRDVKQKMGEVKRAAERERERDHPFPNLTSCWYGLLCCFHLV